MKFTLFVPNYAHNSAGVRCLYYLAEYLIDLGHEVDGINYQKPSEPPPEWCRIRFVERIQRSLCIVPESIVLEVPLPKLRWVLNVPGKLGGPKHYGNDEIVVYFKELEEAAKAASFDGTAFPLTIGALERIKDLGKKRILDLWYEGKGQSDDSHPVDAIRLTRHWPPTRPELFSLLQRAETLYSYDDFTALNFEAYSSGCKTLIRRSGNWEAYEPPEGSEELWKDEDRDREKVRLLIEQIAQRIDILHSLV